MSERYPGGIITKNPATPTGPFDTGAAPGIWTLDQQMQFKQQGVWPTAGLQPNYIEDVFSTFLYTGNGSTQTITNNIDLSGKGGLVWIKGRTDPGDGAGVPNHILFDTVRGNDFFLRTSTTAAQGSGFSSLFQFQNNGFTVGNNHSINYGVNNTQYVSWTFREQAKFFDVVTYTGSGSGTQTIAHNLGSVPGCIITKLVSGSDTSGVGGWGVYHRSTGASQVLELNTTAAAATDNWYTTAPTSTNFYVFGNDPHSNRSGGTYIAYIFAHDAGGFGLTGTDNVISCGSYVGNGLTAGPAVTLGYEPQWVIIKSASAVGNWSMFDNMRGVATASAAGNGLDARLLANDAAAEDANTDLLSFTSTGFQIDSSFGAVNTSGATYIYIAIRRGPMKVPTLGTSVFAPVTQAGGGFDTAGFPVDLLVLQGRSAVSGATWTDRLRGSSKYLNSSSTAAESSTGGIFAFDNQTGVQDNYFGSGTSVAYWNMRRAPGFFDEVCYTGTGTDDRQVTHNLQAAPELVIVKSRSDAWPWWVGGSVLGSTRNGMYLNDTSAKQTNADAFSTNGAVFTSSYFLVSNVSAYPPNPGSGSLVAYLFATCAGVSKVGSYTGNGSTQTINCGFTGGARFVLIKRTDSTGDWYTYDTARGMTVLTDPYLLLNTTAAEVATLGSVTTVSTGFALNSAILADINISAGSYIFLAIA